MGEMSERLEALTEQNLDDQRKLAMNSAGEWGQSIALVYVGDCIRQLTAAVRKAGRSER